MKLEGWLFLLGMVVFVSGPDCAAWNSAKPAIRTANDIATAWCVAYNVKKAGITAEQAADQFCSTQAQLRPWLDLILAGERDGVAKLGVPKECPK